MPPHRPETRPSPHTSDTPRATLVACGACGRSPLRRLRGVDPVIHTYDREPFREMGNAFLFSGGSEGIVADGTTPPRPLLLHQVNTVTSLRLPPALPPPLSSDGCRVRLSSGNVLFHSNLGAVRNSTLEMGISYCFACLVAVWYRALLWLMITV
ncbi:hypothetical protein U9M48_029469 [Paspalum notatum var. saurae]|uniref:Uncharacterized protein n=1 Tax=Paspalum notatum var. saurae TaxID=547442 RepID=A0AAQ3TYX2_PASNO